ncbi:hypothetical protein D3C71_1289260 [compost metagenome]
MIQIKVNLLGANKDICGPRQYRASTVYGITDTTRLFIVDPNRAAAHSKITAMTTMATMGCPGISLTVGSEIICENIS